MTWTQCQLGKPRGYCGCSLEPSPAWAAWSSVSSRGAHAWPGQGQDTGLAVPLVQAGVSDHFHHLQSSLYSPCFVQLRDASFACNAFGEVTLLNAAGTRPSPPARHRVSSPSSGSVTPSYLAAKCVLGVFQHAGRDCTVSSDLVASQQSKKTKASKQKRG